MGYISDLIAALHGDDFPAAVLALVALALVGVASWALVISLLATCPALRGLAVALTPRILRAALFTGVVGALTVPAAQAEERELDGLQLPDRPVLVDRSTPVHRSTAVVVRTGDTLWALAQARLGPHATAAVIARETDRWHDANRAVVGADPDVIHPGQRLIPPAKDRP